ncbi:hypothetical protein COV17_04185 [Candidatus Woesearchaeota archaeon CG10_big_fil_rev_8_21_14_0_10_36_11]|nr:MAG: hypothetical protein COV17_04185 [Candidatus Woesearchaeota archaeon CG10_big_fil_rev_8_21_14_0_10_36_11]
MNIKQIFTPKRIVFLFIFFVLVLIGLNINFSSVVGAENQFFTLFQFFGPIAGTFLGPVFGIISVFFSQFADFLIVGKEFTLINVLRLLPMLFAVYYFSSKKKAVSAIIPLICMFLFIIHPIGRVAWLYSLYWLIPFFAKVLPDKVPGKLFLRSFGATFTAHAIGSVLWIYTVPMTAGQWIGLIPVVAYERFLFGLGIAGSYVVFNSVLDYVVSKWKLRVPQNVLVLDKKYTLSRLLHLKKV